MTTPGESLGQGFRAHRGQRAAGQIPAGWALCDGQNNTPDLRGRFVLGAGQEYEAGAMGGVEEVALTVEQMPKHAHMSPTETQTPSAPPNGRFLVSVDGQYTQEHILPHGMRAGAYRMRICPRIMRCVT